MTKFKKKLASLDGLDESFHGLYEESGDGFALKPGLELPGTVSETVHAGFRDNNRKLNGQLETLQSDLDGLKKKFGGIDPDRYTKAIEALDNIEEDEERRLIKEGKIDEVVSRRTATAISENQRATTQLKTTLSEKDATIAKLRGKLGVLTVDAEFEVALEAAGVKPKGGAMKDLKRRARETWQVNDEGVMHAIDDQNKTRYGANGESLKMAEFVTSDILEGASHLIEAAKGGGGGGGENPNQHDKNAGKIKVDRGDPEAMGRHAKDIISGKAVVVG